MSWKNGRRGASERRYLFLRLEASRYTEARTENFDLPAGLVGPPHKMIFGTAATEVRVVPVAQSAVQIHHHER